MNFEVGKTYTTRSICDSECLIRATIIRRTAKTVTLASGKTFRLSVYRDVEQFRPWGNYSMSPVIDATDAG